jgi:acetyl esterase/lipase
MRRGAAMLCAALVLGGCGFGPATTSAPARTAPAHATATYCTDGGTAETLDVYEPSRGTAPHPLLLVIHGGSWAFGSSALAGQNPLARMTVTAMLSRGFAVASINYRLAPANPWPAQIIDVRCAVRYLRATAARWNLDPQRFTALGTSAGAQLASLAALSAGAEPQWDNGLYTGESGGFAAVVDCWGPADLTAPGWGALAAAIAEPVFRAAVGSDSQALRDASPVTWVHAGAPPFLIIQGSRDTLVPAQQSAELQARLASAGAVATLIPVANAEHELRPVGGAISPGLDALTARVVAFLQSAVA